MSNEAKDLLARALTLPDDEREALALRLLASLGEDSPEDVEEAWLDEAERRLEAVRAGLLPTEPCENVRAEIFRR